MRKLSIYLVITFFIFEIICRFSPIPWMFEASFSQIGSLRSVQKEIDENTNIDYIFFGNSLTRDAISPLLINQYQDSDTSSLNLGVSAGSTFVDYKLLLNLIEYPEIIFIQSDLPRLALNFSDSFYFKKLSTFEDWSNINTNKLNLSNSPSKLLQSIDIWHRFIFYRDGTARIGETLKKDYLGQFDVYDDELLIDQGAFSHDFYDNNWVEKINDDSLYFFQKICEYSKIHEIQIVLIHLPLNSENLQNKEIIINNYLQHLENECVADTEILNYTTELNSNLDLFLDYGHLNNAGAEIFTNILAEDINDLVNK